MVKRYSCNPGGCRNTRALVRIRTPPNGERGNRPDSRHPRDWQLHTPPCRYGGHEACHRGAARGQPPWKPTHPLPSMHYKISHKLRPCCCMRVALSRGARSFGAAAVQSHRSTRFWVNGSLKLPFKPSSNRVESCLRVESLNRVALTRVGITSWSKTSS